MTFLFNLNIWLIRILGILVLLFGVLKTRKNFKTIPLYAETAKRIFRPLVITLYIEFFIGIFYLLISSLLS